MTSLIPTLAVTFVLVAICHARAASVESGNLLQTSGFHPNAEDFNENQETDTSFREALEDRHLVRLNGQSLDLRGDWLSHAPHFADEVDKRYKPSGFLGSRGKRLLPGLEPLLLARYYQGNYILHIVGGSECRCICSDNGGKTTRDAEKRKRQPHDGFHGSRG